MHSIKDASQQDLSYEIYEIQMVKLMHLNKNQSSKNTSEFRQIDKSREVVSGMVKKGQTYLGLSPFLRPLYQEQVYILL